LYRKKQWKEGGVLEIKKTIKAFSLKEAIEAMNADADESAVIAGGTDIMIELREGSLGHSVLVDVSDVAEMKNISVAPEEIRIGAAVTFTEIVKSQEIKKALPGLWEACKSVGATQIRNMGTLGGNVANGSPAADSVPPLLALGSKLIVASPSGESTVELSEFFVGKGRTALPKGAIIKEIVVPMNGKGSRIVGFEKLGLRNALAISRISAAVALSVEGGKITEASVASGSIGLTPTVEGEMGRFLVGRAAGEETAFVAAGHFSMIVAERLKGRSTAEFKQEAVRGVITRALEKAFSQANS
jgi:CO/xanthine dehydrogenase FAD-binding subunit